MVWNRALDVGDFGFMRRDYILLYFMLVLNCVHLLSDSVLCETSFVPCPQSKTRSHKGCDVLSVPVKILGLPSASYLSYGILRILRYSRS